MDPYWLDEDTSSLATSPVRGTVDVAIVGAGITGCAAALVLAEAGRRVRIHEARTVASGASGRNGGFALQGGAARYDVARDSYGASQALELWRRTETALDRLEGLAGDALRRKGSLRLAADEEERDDIRAEYEALREDGIEAEWRDRLPRPLEGQFLGAIFHPQDGSVHPARLVRLLALAAVKAGAEIVQNDPVTDLSALEAERVLIATDGYGRGLVAALDDAIWPARGQVLVTEPLPEVVFPCPHYARQGFDYWQQLPDRRLLLGGFRDFSIMSELTDVEETTPEIQGALDSFLRELVPGEVKVTHRWAGIFGLTQDLLPLAGVIPGDGEVWVAAGYSGHGNVLGFLCGELVAHALLGEDDPLLELLDPARLI